MIIGLDHVILAVRDLGVARDRYRTLLGLEPSWTGEHPEAGTANVLFRVENTYLELLAPAGEGPTRGLLEAWLDAHGEGLLGLAFATQDAVGCRSGFGERGLQPGEVEEGHGRDLATGAVRRWKRVPLSPARTRGVLVFAIEHLADAGTGLAAAPHAAEGPASRDGLARSIPIAGPHAAGSCVHALDHVVVRTGDAEGAKALYGDALGLRLALEREFADWGVKLMFFRTGGVTVEVAAALATPGGADAGSDSLWGLSWKVRDIDAAHARLSAAGLDVSEVRTGRRPGTRVLTVRDGACGVATLMLEVETRD